MAIFEIKPGISCATQSNVKKNTPRMPIPVLDLRSVLAFNQSHIINSASFPIEELSDRLHELPVRTRPIELFGSLEQLQKATAFLSGKGYLIVNRQVASEKKLLQLKQSEKLVSGGAYQRLWQPAAIVKRFIQSYAADCENKSGLDLACGSGRDSVYMSMQGFTMTAIDYLPSALEKLSDLAGRCEQSIHVIQLDLEKTSEETNKNPFEVLAGPFGCVTVVRYLHRPGLAQLKSLIDVGGYIVYQTFMKGCEEFGSPKNPRFLLEAGELANIFSDFEILVDDVEYLADGRPTNCFIAKRII